MIDERPGLIDADEAFAQVLTADGRIDSSTRSVAHTPLLAASRLAEIRGSTFLDLRPPGLDSSRVLVVPAGDGRFIVVGATLSNSQEALYRLLELFAVALPVALIVSSLIGWWLAGLALRPVSRMIDEAERISALDPGRRLPVPDTDPALERLALALNATLDRLQAAYERERAFADNASHELRTPLTVLKAEVDSALAGRGRRPISARRWCPRRPRSTTSSASPRVCWCSHVPMAARSPPCVRRPGSTIWSRSACGRRAGGRPSAA